MQRERVFVYLYSICVLLMLLVQSNCSNTKPASRNIKLYIYEDNNKQIKLNAKLFIKQKPVLILNEESVHKVKLIQRKRNNFALAIELLKHAGNELQRITSVNKGKRLVFISNDQILFAPLILEATKQKKVLIELPIMEKEEAENIAKYFSNSFEFINEYFSYEKIDSDFKKAFELRNVAEYDSAIKILEQIIRQTKVPYKNVFLYNEIALCYRLKNDNTNAAETYRKLINEQVNIDLDNYMVISQAYFYLSEFEKKQQNINLSKKYFNQGIATLEFIVKNFPTTRSAEWASLTMGGYELLRGNADEARKRAVIAKGGDFKGQGYLLLGLCYEYQKEFEKARNEYNRLIKNLPNSDESETAQGFIKTLDSNKTNIEEFLNTLSLH